MDNLRIKEELEFRKFFAKRLRMARLAANLSQKGLAYYLQVGQDTISNNERGKVIPNILILYHMAEILGINVSYFFPDVCFHNKL
jgi:transcriptional regulator with XRE-family HTH domain